MNKQKSTQLALVIGCGLVLSACGVKDKIEQKVTSKVVEHQIEEQSGGKVKVDDGQITVKTDDGQVQYSTGDDVKVPEGFPKELIVGANTKMEVAATSDKGYSLTYTTGDTKKDVFDGFLALTSVGWKKEMELNTDSGMMLVLGKDKLKVTVAMSQTEGTDKTSTTVNVVLGME
ncbi:hypothetical protein KBC75_04175 [Candidatus Shapirobacteria bacterium]|nr:hypothetical protein [Candidatus Shapirobacteria bacterium]